MAIHELSALLWRERELLDVLTFKLEEEQLLLTAGTYDAHGKTGESAGSRIFDKQF